MNDLTPPVWRLVDDATRSCLSRLEQTDELSWDLDRGGAPAEAVVRSRAGSDGEESGLIFDHAPKTGGNTFHLLCHRRLRPADHVQISWPGSWNGILLGRLLEARIVHGHGARYALSLFPSRKWLRVTLIRDPSELAMSFYQEQSRGAARRGVAAPSVDEWLAQMLSERRRLGQRGPHLNLQTSWFGLERPPTAHPPYFELVGAGRDEDLLERAWQYLKGLDLIAATSSVADVFDAAVRRLRLPVRPPLRESVRANASAAPAAVLLEQLSEELKEGLAELTQLDTELISRVRGLNTFAQCGT